MKSVVLAGLSGVIFSLGLALGGMTDPARIVGFLDFAGDWDPSLAFVMAGALGTHALLRRVILRRERPVFAPSFPPLSKLTIDRRLVLGSALFGIGWGLGGYCPGPAFTALGSGSGSVLAFVLAMGGGMFLFRLWDCGFSGVFGGARGKAERAAP